MGLLGFLNKSKKSGRTIEEQLNVLAGVGIAPNFDEFADWICGEWGRERVESSAYGLLLYSLGGEREIDGAWLPSSDDIYCFDTECVEDEDIYERVILHLSRIAKGSFDISDAKSSVDHDHGTAAVSFTYCGKSYHWPLQYDNDWFDCDVVGKINTLLQSNGSDSFFYTFSPDQNLYVVCGTELLLKKMNELLPVRFTVSYC